MADDTLSIAESGYYARHLCMPRFGVEGQLALRRSSVLVVGAGGLGSPVTLRPTVWSPAW